LASLGSKKIADPGELAVFNRLKKEAERVCLKVGTRFLGGFAVPEDFIGPIQTELERIAMGFNLARDSFLSGYDDAVKGWVAKHPEFAEAITRAVDPVGTVAANLRFDYVLFRVSQPQLPEEDISPELTARKGAIGVSHNATGSVHAIPIARLIRVQTGLNAASMFRSVRSEYVAAVTPAISDGRCKFAPRGCTRKVLALPSIPVKRPSSKIKLSRAIGVVIPRCVDVSSGVKTSTAKSNSTALSTMLSIVVDDKAKTP
jgi:hypothetical protein